MDCLTAQRIDSFSYEVCTLVVSLTIGSVHRDLESDESRSSCINLERTKVFVLNTFLNPHPPPLSSIILSFYHLPLLLLHQPHAQPLRSPALPTRCSMTKGEFPCSCHCFDSHSSSPHPSFMTYPGKLAISVDSIETFEASVSIGLRSLTSGLLSRGMLSPLSATGLLLNIPPVARGFLDYLFAVVGEDPKTASLFTAPVKSFLEVSVTVSLTYALRSLQLTLCHKGTSVELSNDQGKATLTFDCEIEQEDFMGYFHAALIRPAVNLADLDLEDDASDDEASNDGSENMTPISASEMQFAMSVDLAETWCAIEEVVTDGVAEGTATPDGVDYDWYYVI